MLPIQDVFGERGLSQACALGDWSRRTRRFVLASCVGIVAVVGACQDSHDASGIVGSHRSRPGLSFDQVPQPSIPGALTNQGGPVLVAPNVYAIYWGPGWGTNSSFTNDKITALQSLFSGLSGTGYLGVLNQYISPSFPGLASSLSFQGTFYDTTTPPNIPISSTLLNDISSKICAVLAAHSITPSAQAVYEVFSTVYPYVGGPESFHDLSAAGCSSIPVHFAYVYNLDSLSSLVGGRSADVVSDGVYHSDSAAALANAAAHELAEAITDPALTAWYKTSIEGGEVADKCSFVFSGGYVPLSNGDHFKLQALWSNQAFSTSSGIPNGNSPAENGCSVNGGLAPPLVTGSVGAGPSAQMSWPSVFQATEYFICQSNSSDPGDWFCWSLGSATSWSETGLDFTSRSLSFPTPQRGPWVAFYIVASNSATGQGFPSDVEYFLYTP